MIRVLIRSRGANSPLLLYYVDPLTGREVSRSAKTQLRREAERAAARWEEELRSGAAQGRDLSWELFRRRFEDEHLATLAPKTRLAYGTALNHFEAEIGKPRSISLVDSQLLSRFAARLRDKNHPPTSIATYLRHVRGALGWAAKMGMIGAVPRVIMPRTGKRRLARSRPLTDAEFGRIVERSQQLENAGEWRRFLLGLWTSGLRLGEILSLQWDAAPLRVELTGRRPRIVVWIEGHKNRADEIIPITPDFHRLLMETPPSDRTGPVFRLGIPRREVSDKLTDLARDAEVFVNDANKPATAHDYRRSFGTRWALRVHPVVLQRIMRHRAINTTMAYYVELDADKIADQLWEFPDSPEKTPDTAPPPE